MFSHIRPIIITGPTASGKTDLAESLAQHLGGEIVNADVGQFYTGLNVGTAKPDWQKKPFPCHLFDIFDKPAELTVAAYRSLVIELVNDISRRQKVPIIVGGSLFYVKSLFFPPQEHRAQKKIDDEKNSIDFSQSSTALWEILKTIDFDRAQALHPHDRYRIARALHIWLNTGQKPSSFQPIYTPPFSAHVIFLTPPKDVLSQRISQRTHTMITADGWIDEAKELLVTGWQDFIERKGIIGYKTIFEWLVKGSQEIPPSLISDIAQETRHYAKRQMVFLKKFKQQLEEQAINHMTHYVTIQELYQCDDVTSSDDFSKNFATRDIPSAKGGML